MLDVVLGMASTFWALVPVTLAQSLLLSFAVLGIMIPFRMLNFPDLTSEGAFPLGGCLGGILVLAGWHPALAIGAAIVAGFAAGCATALIHLRLRIHTLLAGILMMTMLYSVNLRILGRSNIAIFGKGSVFDGLPNLVGTPAKIAVAGGLALIVLLVLNWAFRTERGIALRAVGANPDMAEAQGINVGWAVIAGVGLAGALSALAGAIMAQSQGFADVNMGFGILINGLAALMIGEALIGKGTLTQTLLAPFIGSIVYYQLVSLCYAAGLPPSDNRLATGLFVLALLGLPQLRAATGWQRSMSREAIRE